MNNQENKESIYKIDELDRIIIPNTIRETLELNEGQEMRISADKWQGVVVLEPIKD